MSKPAGKLRKAELAADNSATNSLDRPTHKSECCNADKTEQVQINLVKETCLFADCQINNVKVKFLVDTGSPVSLISNETFKKLKLDSPLNKISSTLSTANGNLLTVKGKCTLNIEIGPFEVTQELIVADIKGSSGILGMNFFHENEIDIQIRSQSLRIKDQSIPLYKETSSQCSRIQIAKQVSIPPFSEKVIEGYAKDLFVENIGIIEPLDWVKSKGMIVARSIVDTENKIYIGIMNLNSKPVKLKQGSNIANLMTIDDVFYDNSHLSQTNYKQSDEIDQVNILTQDQELPEHLKPILNKVSSQLTDNERHKLSLLIQEYSDIFVGPDGALGHTDIVKHNINTGDSKPVKIAPRRIAIKQRDVLEEELKKLLDNNLIEPSNSPWAAPVCLVKKRDGTVRFCVDFRKLNERTVKDAYPLPRIDDTLDTLNGGKWFSCVDLASGYFQVQCAEEDKHKTAFSTHKGLYQFLVMPMGLCNSPATFSRLMNSVLGSLQWHRCLCYLDDVIIFGKDFQIALDNLKAVFDCFRQANLKLKPSKCSLFQTEVKFLGHIVSESGITCDPEKVQSVKNWHTPSKVKELRSFLGFAGYYRRFIPEFSTIAHPLTQLTQKNRPFDWDEKCEVAFETLKDCLITAPTLSFPTADGTYILDTDASQTGVGAVLSQIQNNEERVIAYSSRTLNRAQRQYCTTKRELLAAIIFLCQFRHYLYGQRFILRTDHASLIWLKNFKNPEGIIARWISIIDTYDIDIQHRRGAQHTNADGLSRTPTKKCKRPNCPDCTEMDTDIEYFEQAKTKDGKDDSNTVKDVQASYLRVHSVVDATVNGGDTDTVRDCQTTHLGVSPVNVSDEKLSFSENCSNWLQFWSNSQLREMQENDPDISFILNKKLQSNEKPKKSEIGGKSKETKMLYALWESLVIHEDILYKFFEKENQGILYQFVAPKEVRDFIFEQLHSSKFSAHFGRDKTLELIKRRFYWPNLSESVKRWCNSCNICAKGKPGPGKGKSPLKSSIPTYPLDRLAIDIMGPLPKTRDSNEYIMVVEDYFTKWTEAYAIQNHQALTVADKLVTEFICRFGCPSQIHTDQGREFESNLFASICDKLGIDKTRTCPYRPQSDGMVERFNRTLQNILCLFVNEHRNDWDDHLPFITMAYRATQHASSHCTPNILMFGHEIRCPVDLMFGLPQGQPSIPCPIAYVEWVQQALNKAFQFAHKHLGLSATRQKETYDKNLKIREFEENSFVWRWYPPEANKKLGLGWIGPYKVIRKISDLLYKIQKDRKTKSIVVHVDHLKQYIGEKIPSNWEDTVNSNNIDICETDKNTNTLPSPIKTRSGRTVKPRQIFSP